LTWSSCAVEGTETSTGKSGGSSLRRSLVIAPFLSGQYFCDEALDNPAVGCDEDAALFCASRRSNGARRIKAALDAIGPRISPSGRYQLGYTLIVPLFRYFKKSNGDWIFDTHSLTENLTTIMDVDRPVVVYLSSNHFADSGKALCSELAQDPVNVMWNRSGPMRADAYFDSAVIPWTLENANAPVTVLRRQAFGAAVNCISALSESCRERIIGISILGEVHQAFGNLFAGPGFDSPLSGTTDYAPSAVAGFRKWLVTRYENIDVLNREIGADFASFDAVSPPSRDINTEELTTFFEHLDAHAPGHVAVHGWLHDSENRLLAIEIYLDGQLRGVADYGLSRTDVTDAVPAIRNPNVGFRYYLDFRNTATGIHVLEVVVNINGVGRLRLARQPLVVADRTRVHPPSVHSPETQVASIASELCLAGALDGPKPWAAAHYNPLARLWLIYRNQIVRDYIETFAKIAIGAGIPRDKLFSHQVTPALVGSWNGDLLAVDSSKLPSEFYNQGTTLYGGAAFGIAFGAMKTALGWDSYAVNEMHPMVKLEPSEYPAMFEMHRSNGAVYVAPYFMDLTPERLIFPGNEHERFRIAPDNRRGGSDAYWEGIRAVMQR
jgi:hypothetical protein